MARPSTSFISVVMPRCSASNARETSVSCTIRSGSWTFDASSAEPSTRDVAGAAAGVELASARKCAPLAAQPDVVAEVDDLELAGEHAAGAHRAVRLEGDLPRTERDRRAGVALHDVAVGGDERAVRRPRELAVARVARRLRACRSRRSRGRRGRRRGRVPWSGSGRRGSRSSRAPAATSMAVCSTSAKSGRRASTVGTRSVL